MKDLKALQELLSLNTWEKTKGLFLVMVILIILYFSLCTYFLGEHFNKLHWINFIIIFSILICTYLVWVFTTNRFFFKGSTDMCIAVLVSVEDKKDEKKVNEKIRYVVDKFFNEVKDDFTKKELKIKLLPINYLTNKSSVEKYLNSRSFALDGVIRLNIESGSYHTEDDKKTIEESMKVNTIDYIGFFGLDNKSEFHKGINLINDIQLSGFYKDWKYIYTNDGNDKKKYLKNVKETVLNYCGVYAVYLNKNKLALKILKNIFKPENRSFKAEIENGKGKIQLTGDNLIASRQAGILIDLYFNTAFQKINNNEKEEAVRLLKECDALMNQSHPKRFEHCVTLARMCYEIDDIEGAKYYTKQCSLIRPNSFEVLLNNGWFAIMDNNINDFVYHYKRIKNKGIPTNTNCVDIIEFMGRYESSYHESKLLIETAKGFLWKLGANVKNGNNILDEVLIKINGGSNLKYKELIWFINDVRSIREVTVKRNNIINSKINKRKSKRKKRK